MPGIESFSDVTINLTRTPAAAVNFGVAMHLVDHADVPIDIRYRKLTRPTYAALTTAGTDHVAWMDDLWGQTLNPDELYLTRWVSTNSPSYMWFPNATTDVSVWAALAATAKLKILEDGGGDSEDISPDFTGDTSMADVCASIQTALAASTLAAAYTCSLDILGRIVITSDNTGASAVDVAAGTPTTGVDLTLPAYLGTYQAQDGLDAEALEDSMNLVLAVDNTPFAITQAGGSIAQQVALSTAVNALDKLLFLTNNDANAKASAPTTDVGYLIEALGHNQTFIVYTEHTADNPDACICGEILPYTEAKRSFALWPMLELNASGLAPDGTTVIPMTTAEEVVLKAKGYDWIVSPRTLEHTTHGLAPGGNEIRIMFGKFFAEAMITDEVYAYMLAQDVVTYSDDDILAVQGIIEKWLDEMVSRKVLEPDYTVTMPSASSFSAATKATHIMDLANVAEADAQISVNKITISLSWAV